MMRLYFHNRVSRLADGANGGLPPYPRDIYGQKKYGEGASC
jgi:hypothetical protein